MSIQLMFGEEEKVLFFANADKDNNNLLLELASNNPKYNKIVGGKIRAILSSDKINV